MKYTKQKHHNWLSSWQELESFGKNVGIEHIINPYLYRHIITSIDESKPVSLLDFGCGTGSLGFDLLHKPPSTVPGLSSFSQNSIKLFRKSIKGYVGFEFQHDLVGLSKSIVKKYALNNFFVFQHDATKPSFFLSDPVLNPPNLAVSRNFFMHLNNKDLGAHLAQSAAVLPKKGLYVCAFLNPAYEQNKHNHTLLNNSWYDYHHGVCGEYGDFRQFFRETLAYESLFSKDFSIISKEPCVPLSDFFKKSHPRYYNKNTPMAFCYVLEKK